MSGSVEGADLRLEAGVGCNSAEVWICKRQQLRELALASVDVFGGVSRWGFRGRPIETF